MMDTPPIIDPNAPNPVAGFLVKHGLSGLINLHAHDDPNIYQGHIENGHKKIKNHVEHLFGGKEPVREDHSKRHKQIDDWMTKGGITADLQDEIQGEPVQNFAEGGKVKAPGKSLHNHMIASQFPDHNLGLQIAKGRMSQYLNSLRPQENVPRLAFDAPMDDPHRKQAYERAKSIAANPLGILDNLKKGTLQKEDISHFTALHPEVSDAVQKELNMKVLDAQLTGKKPSYKVRQGLSMLLGAPLSADMLPQNIHAAQQVFQHQSMQQPAQPGQATKPKKNTSKLTHSDQSFLTGNQARTMREQKQ